MGAGSPPIEGPTDRFALAPGACIVPVVSWAALAPILILSLAFVVYLLGRHGPVRGQGPPEVGVGDHRGPVDPPRRDHLPAGGPRTPVSPATRWCGRPDCARSTGRTSRWRAWTSRCRRERLRPGGTERRGEDDAARDPRRPAPAHVGRGARRRRAAQGRRAARHAAVRPVAHRPRGRRSGADAGRAGAARPTAWTTRSREAGLDDAAGPARRRVLARHAPAARPGRDRRRRAGAAPPGRTVRRAGPRRSARRPRPRGAPGRRTPPCCSPATSSATSNASATRSACSARAASSTRARWRTCSPGGRRPRTGSACATGSTGSRRRCAPQPWVARVEPTDGPGDAAGRRALDRGGRTRAAGALAGAGARIVSVEPEAADLEHVFLELTS